MKLTIDDGRDFDAARVPAPVHRAVSILQKLPDGKLLTPTALANRLLISCDRLCHHAKHPNLIPFRILVNRYRIYYGNPKTIKIAQSQLSK
jgi:hypothetical protein